MLGLVAALCVSLGLARYGVVAGGAVMIGFVIVAAIVLRNTGNAKPLIAGAVLGMIALMVACLIVAWAMGEFPRTSYSQSDFVFSATRPYILPVGGFVGGLAGLVAAALVKASRR